MRTEGIRFENRPRDEIGGELVIAKRSHQHMNHAIRGVALKVRPVKSRRAILANRPVLAVGDDPYHDGGRGFRLCRKEDVTAERTLLEKIPSNEF